MPKRGHAQLNCLSTQFNFMQYQHFKFLSHAGFSRFFNNFTVVIILKIGIMGALCRVSTGKSSMVGQRGAERGRERRGERRGGEGRGGEVTEKEGKNQQSENHPEKL